MEEIQQLNSIPNESDKQFVAFVGKRMEELRKWLPKLTQAQAAVIAGVSVRMWGIYEKGEGPIAPLEVLSRFAENRGITIGKLLSREDLEKKPIVLFPHQIPIVDHIPAGPLTQAFGESGIMGYIDSDINDPEAFALVVTGSSMSPRIIEGDVVICSPKEPFVSGKVYATVVGEGEQSLKQVRYDPRSKAYALIPFNKEFPTLYVPEQDVIKLVRVVRNVSDF